MSAVTAELAAALGIDARLVHRGDTIIVISYAQYTEAELETYAPRVVHVFAFERRVLRVRHQRARPPQGHAGAAHALGTRLPDHRAPPRRSRPGCTGRRRSSRWCWTCS